MPFTSLCDIAHSYYSKREFSQSKILFCPSLFYKAEFYKDKKNRHEPHYNILRLDKILFRSLLLQIIILDKQPPKKSVKLKNPRRRKSPIIRIGNCDGDKMSSRYLRKYAMFISNKLIIDFSRIFGEKH